MALGKYSNTVDEEKNQIRFFSGQQNHKVCDSSSADVPLTGEDAKCRYAKVDVTGIIKVTYKSDGGADRTEVLVANAGEKILIPNITTVYRYYVDTTPCTAQVYTDAGALVVGLKLCY
jgi:hypothetical protein